MDPLKLLQKVLQPQVDFALNASPQQRIGAFNSNLQTIASDPIRRISFGGDMAGTAPWAVPPTTSVEQMSNLASGWKQPNLKSEFDYAMLTNDTDKIKKLLPNVPEGYLQNKFGPEVYQKLLGKADPMQRVLQGMSQAANKAAPDAANNYYAPGFKFN